MKIHTLLAFVLSLSAAGAYAEDGFDRTKAHRFAAPHAQASGYAEDGFDRTGAQRFAEDGFDRTHGHRIS